MIYEGETDLLVEQPSKVGSFVDVMTAAMAIVMMRQYQQLSLTQLNDLGW